VVTHRLQAEHRTGSVRRPKTGVLPTVLRNQLVLYLGTLLLVVTSVYSFLPVTVVCYVIS